MNRRINVTRQYVKTQSQQNLRERLKQEALANGARDLQIAAEWFPLEEEAWKLAQSGKSKGRVSPPGRDIPLSELK